MFSKDGNTKDVKTPRICDVVWHNGEFIQWTDARVHVMSHVLHYGSSVFEGIRCYSTTQGPAIFRLREHMQRFLNSAKIYRMDHEWTLDQLCTASIDLVKRSGMDQCYIRPILFRSLDEEHPAFGVNPFPNPLACYIGAWDWGKYLGDEAIERGVDVCVSTWQRLRELDARDGKERRQLHELAVDQDGSASEWLRGRHRARRSWLRFGRFGENIFLVPATSF
jgi:branched-chain amino acid aminotransferase